MELLEKFLAQVQALPAVWMPFVVAMVIVALGMWRLMEWAYKSRIERLTTRIGQVEDECDHLKGKLQRNEKPTIKPTPEESAPVPSQLPPLTQGPLAEAVPENRILLGEKVTPKFLADLRAGKTKIQADRAISMYLGKWMRHTGVVQDTDTLRGDRAMISFRISNPFELSALAANVIAFFDVVPNELEILHRGDEVTVLGQLEQMDEFGLKLTKCELIRPTT